MTREEVMEMASQAGLIGKPTYTEGLETFAKLVAQHEREACAKLCEWRTGVQQVDAAIDTCAAAIRARGQA